MIRVPLMGGMAGSDKNQKGEHEGGHRESEMARENQVNCWVQDSNDEQDVEIFQILQSSSRFCQTPRDPYSSALTTKTRLRQISPDGICTAASHGHANSF